LPQCSGHQTATGHHEAWHRADVVTLGFPCQDISFAGNGAGITGDRVPTYGGGVAEPFAWYDRPYAIVENVAALLRRGVDTVLGDLAEIGYDAEWHCIPASHVGAPHRRTASGLLPTPSGVNGGKNHTVGRLDEWGGSSNPFRGTDLARVRCASFEECTPESSQARMTLVEALRYHASLMIAPEVAPKVRALLNDASTVMWAAAEALSTESESVAEKR
jgi:hypothetical protein